MHSDVPRLLRLMLVVDDHLLSGRDLASLCQAAERGGVTSVLVRLRKLTPRELAAAVRAVLGAARVPVLVSDRADVAIASGAVGVQLGSDGVPLQLIRRIAPQGFVIGVSVGTFTEVENGRGADFWTVGPFRVSGLEVDTRRALGPAGFAAIVRRAEGRPCVAFGGVQPRDVPGVLAAGGVGTSVDSGILEHEDIAAATRAFCRADRE